MEGMKLVRFERNFDWCEDPVARAFESGGSFIGEVEPSTIGSVEELPSDWADALIEAGVAVEVEEEEIPV